MLSFVCRSLSGAACLLAFPLFGASPLAEAPSAFLRTHADSPVNWVPWSTAAFDRAQAEDKPLFVAVGGFELELSRAMREQTFARPDVAEHLNENFVCVVVDRDEQPAVVALHEAYVRAVKQQGGWPLNVWLTPEGKPFDGAAYLPPSEEWGVEGFLTASTRVAAAWAADSDAQRRKGDEAVNLVAELERSETAPIVSHAKVRELLTNESAAYLRSFDPLQAAFGEPPRYPEPELLRFLLQGNEAEREAAKSALRKLATGALRDPLDGGFFRYTVDDEGKLPYLQKALTDQARLALAFLDLAASDGDSQWRDVVFGALDYALGLWNPTDGFAALEDATPEDVARFYFWSADEIDDVLGPATGAVFRRSFAVTDEGNLPVDAYLGLELEQENMLYWAGSTGTELGPERLAESREKLRAHRAQRIHPLQDSRATSGAHGLLLTALVRAGAELSEPRFADAAAKLASFIQHELRFENGRLRRRSSGALEAAPGDYAWVIRGLLVYGDTQHEASARELAYELRKRLVVAYADPVSSHYFAVPTPAPPRAWGRVHVPAPDRGEIPRAECVVLMTFADDTVAEDMDLERRASTIVAGIENGFEIARGDQLLALRRYIADR